MINTPALGTRRLARDATGWNISDPDLRHELGRGGLVVELRMVGTGDPQLENEELASEYEAMYREDGLNVLPPVWAWEGGPFPMLITGLQMLDTVRPDCSCAYIAVRWRSREATPARQEGPRRAHRHTPVSAARTRS
uniref:hypothetical protein n=1 Tax=Nonomuraea sp. CA-251285 TaxID=3240002 RepID=UPI003F493382